MNKKGLGCYFFVIQTNVFFYQYRWWWSCRRILKQYARKKTCYRHIFLSRIKELALVFVVWPIIILLVPVTASTCSASSHTVSSFLYAHRYHNGPSVSKSLFFFGGGGGCIFDIHVSDCSVWCSKGTENLVKSLEDEAEVVDDAELLPIKNPKARLFG